MSEVTLADVIDSMRSYHVKFSQAAPVERVEAFADDLDAIADKLEGVADDCSAEAWIRIRARIRAIIGADDAD